MKKLFQIELGYEESTDEWSCVIISIPDLKLKSIVSNSIHTLFNKIRKEISKKELEMRKFPVPEPTRIISLTKPAPRIIVPSQNGH